jgi:hypothetical protein
MIGSVGVLIGGKPAARMGDQCMHGGSIVMGCPTVMIGEAGGGGGGGIGAVPVPVLAKVMANAPQELKIVLAQVIAMKEAAKNGDVLAHNASTCTICAENGTHS